MKEDSLPRGIRARSRSPSPPQTQHSTSQQPECKPQLLPQTNRKRRPQPLSSFVALVLTSALTSELLARLAHRSTLTVLSFPFWTSTSLLLVVYRVRKRRKESRDKEGLLSATKNILRLGGRGTEGTARVLATAASFVGSLALRIWSLRWIDSKEAQAIEIFILPVLILFWPRFSQSRISGGSQQDYLQLVAAGSAFCVGTSLIGISGVSKLGLAFSVLRIPIEACSIALLKEGISEEDEESRSDWMLRSVVGSTLLSLLLLPIVFFLPSQRYTLPSFSFITYLFPCLLSSAAVLSFTLSMLLLLILLRSYDSPLLPALHLLPRNAVNLVFGVLSNGLVAARGNWLQLWIVYIVGATAVTVKLTQEEESVDDEKDETGKEAEDDGFQYSKYVTYLSFIPLLVFAVHSTTTTVSTALQTPCTLLPPTIRPISCPSTLPALPSQTVDLVVSYYNEDLDTTLQNLDYVRRVSFVSERDTKVVLYNKGLRDESVLRKALRLKDWDQVIPLENVGREGATYLQHILRNYNDSLSASSPSSFADHTFFLQPHIAWSGIGKPRLWMIPSNVGFASFGPLRLLINGEDPDHGDYPMIQDVYSMFRRRLAPQRIVIAWSAQFVVSRRRIMANDYSSYKELSDLIEAPADHWLHQLWGPDNSGGPSNPTFGHVVERSWPTIFDCMGADEIDEECFGETIGFMKKCLCRDN